MSSQDSDGESYVSHLIADPKTYGDLSPCGRTTDEEDAHLMRINDSSSEEENALYLNQGICTWSSRSLVSLRGLNYLIIDLFRLVFDRKAKEIYVTKFWSWNRRSIIYRRTLLFSIWKSWRHNYHHHHLRRKSNKYMGMGTPLGGCQAWGRCPGIVSPSHSYLYCFS